MPLRTMPSLRYSAYVYSEFWPCQESNYRSVSGLRIYGLIARSTATYGYRFSQIWNESDGSSIHITRKFCIPVSRQLWNIHVLYFLLRDVCAMICLKAIKLGALNYVTGAMRNCNVSLAQCFLIHNWLTFIRPTIFDCHFIYLSLGTTCINEKHY